MSKHSKKDIQQAATLFFRVRGLVRTTLAQGRKLDPYAWLRIETMVYIRDQKNPSMKEIADYLSIAAPSATSLIGLLIKDGLVLKRGDRKDRRTTRVLLTAKGRRLLHRTTTSGIKLLGTVFASLSHSELAAFSRALKRILESSQRV